MIEHALYDNWTHHVPLTHHYRHIRRIQQVDPSAARFIEGMIDINTPRDEYADSQMIECMW